MGNARTRFGLLPKIIVFLAAVLIPLAAVTWYASVRTLRAQMTEEFTSKGTAIANSLASSGVDLILNRDASTVQARVDEVISGKDAISGVAYVMVYDPQKTLIAHTFHPIVPPDLIDKNLVPGETPKQVREIHYAHPVTGAMRSIIDVGVPMLAGQLGTVRVGMDKAIIEAAAAKPGWYLLLMFGGVALLAVMAGAVFARRITRPLGEIVRAAEQVGRGDLSHTVRVRSRDEIGQLARTFNDTVTRLLTDLKDANSLGTRPGTVKSRAHRALRHLQTRLAHLSPGGGESDQLLVRRAISAGAALGDGARSLRDRGGGEGATRARRT